MASREQEWVKYDQRKKLNLTLSGPSILPKNLFEIGFETLSRREIQIYSLSEEPACQVFNIQT